MLLHARELREQTRRFFDEFAAVVVARACEAHRCGKETRLTRPAADDDYLLRPLQSTLQVRMTPNLQPDR